MTPVDLPYVPILLNETFITALWDTGEEKSFISEEVYRRYFSYRPRQKTTDRVVTAQGAPCCHLGRFDGTGIELMTCLPWLDTLTTGLPQPLGRFELQIRIREFQKTWEFHILNNMQYQCILGIDFMKESKLTLDFDQKSLIIPDDQIKQSPKVEKPVEIDLSDTKLGEGQKQKLKDLFNSFKGLFSDQPGNPVGDMDGSQISCAALRALALNSREQLIREQREDPELGHIYPYLENPDDGSVNATVCEGWSQDFKLIDGLLFYAKCSTTLGELRVYIPKSLREAILQECHDLPLAGHLGKRKTYLKLRDTCYFPYMRKYIFEYVSTCDRCQKFNYKNALPARRLIPIVSNYPNEIVTLDLLGPYPTSRPERYRFILAITDHSLSGVSLFHYEKFRPKP
ncbi:retrovirus-related Pol polyprotein from transposon 297 [Trichonephila clavipes]|nr:retrovirus-related Pol polyprotein from transposon 297 [Trichonephila clavipes]